MDRRGGPPPARDRHRGPGRRRHARAGAGPARGARRLRRRTKEMITIAVAAYDTSRSRRPVPRHRPAPADGDPSTAEQPLHEGEAMTATTDGSTGALRAPRSLGQRNRPTSRPWRPGYPRPRARAAARRSSILLARQDAAGLVEGRPRDQRHHGRRGPAAPPVPRHPRRADHSRRPPASSAASSATDGTWATFYGGPGELSATIEAYVALRLAGDAPDAPAHGARPPRGSASRAASPPARVFTRIWLALFGWWKWDDLPELPPELIYFPKWFPLNIYDFGCWARQTIVPLTVVSAKRPVRPAPVRRSTSCTPTRRDPNPPQAARPAGELGRRSSSGSTRRCTPTARSRSRRLRRAAMNARRPLDHRAAGERRLLGRHPAARRVLGHRPAPARLRPRPPGDAGRTGVAGPLRRLARGRRPA